MKTIFYSIALLAGIGLANKLQAQCSIAQSSVIVNIKSIVNEADGGCTTVFDFTFDMDDNNGNKWTHIHFWDANAYPNIIYNNGPGPTSSVLNGGGITPLLQTISLDYHGGVNNVSPVYPPDNSVVPQSSGITYTRTLISTGVTTNVTRFAITNISIHSHTCSPIDLRADVWSAQSDNGNNVACGINGVNIRADEPRMRGLIFCQTPRTYTVSYQTKVTRDITFIAYKDVAPFGVFDAGDQLNKVDGPRTVNNTGDPVGLSYNTFGPYNYTGGEVSGNIFDIWVVAKAVGINNNNAIIITNTCAPLPVTFILFTATRNHTNLLLTWITSSEQNNSGFAIERNVNGLWEQITFVNSQSANGNSDIPLTYQYNDQNNNKGITQYRIKQVDFDSKSKYSEVRAVRGEGQMDKIIVYPNPSNDGKINIVFNDANVSRDIAVIDMSGRTIKQIRSVSNNNITIDNLPAGMYCVRIIIPTTGEQTMEKIVVKK